MANEYIARTILLQNYFTPSADMADIRRGNGDTGELVSAMKRTELANNMLEKELNAFASRGYQIMTIIQHPMDMNNKNDLLITVVLSKEE